MNDTKLIILRGPSGSGKTTTAKRLFDNAKKRTALIEQDYYRFIFNPPGGGDKPNSDAIREMIKNDVIIALKHGYDVILEGILNIKAYSDVIEEIFSIHPEENYIFYFDVSFEETIKRHRTKPNSHLWTEEDMKHWYPAAHRSNHKFERTIPETLSPDEIYEKIVSEVGL